MASVIGRAWSGGAIVALALAIGGCSDGEVEPGLSAVPDPAAPILSEAEAACATDAECDGLDPGACGEPRCDGRRCVIDPAADGAPCDDGDPCTEGDACEDGACVGGDATCQCESDGDCAAFVEDRCAPAPVCEDGSCVPGDGAPVVCAEPDDPCLDAACDPETGACVEQPVADGTSCGEGDGCAADATCQGGACVLPAGTCDDGDPCTDDVCDPVEGCAHTPRSGACDDGDACTGEGECVEGVCVAEPEGCECAGPQDCRGDGFDPCVGEWACEEGHCALQPDSGVDCSGVETGPCEVAACDPDTGGCVVVPADDGLVCDDGDPCTVGTTCSGGSCGGGAPETCDDGNPCTADKCTAAQGCQHTPVQNAPCDDGDACTEGDRCVAGTCTGGSAVTCGDVGPCTTATCDPDVGCLAVDRPDGDPCDDGDACTEGDRCLDGACVGDDVCACEIDADCPDDGDACNGVTICQDSECVLDEGSVVTCPDEGPCLSAACDPDTGECVTTPESGAPCDDGDPCTASDVCADDGACAGAPLDCDDGDPCTTDACSGGACSHEPVADCVDPCEGVVPGGSCDDEDPDTVADMCLGGVCRGFTTSVHEGTPQAPSVALRKVDHALGRWFVAALVADGFVAEDGAILGTWDDSGALAPYLESFAPGAVYQDLGFGFATDDTGATWVFRPDGGVGSWAADTGLADAVVASGAGLARGLWATAEPAIGADPLLWLVGEDGAGKPWIRRCAVEADASGVEATCHAEETEATDDTLFLAVTGTPCSAVGCTPDLVMGGDNPDSSPLWKTEFYNDTFERDDATTEWGYGFFDQGVSSSRTRDVVSLGGGRVLVVGTDGYLRYRDAQGVWTQNLVVAYGQQGWQLQAAWVEHGTVIVAGWRSEAGGGRGMRLWTMPVGSSPGAAASWTQHPLAVEIGPDTGVFDIAGDGAGTIRVVGSRPGEDGLDGLVFSREAP